MAKVSMKVGGHGIHSFLLLDIDTAQTAGGNVGGRFLSAIGATR